MCGRVALFTPPRRLARFLDAVLSVGIDPEDHPSWNVGPQRYLYAALERDGQRTLERYRWGLVPSWSKDSAIGNRLFNARGETVAQKLSFRSAFAKRPCVIPVDGFYEWDHRVGRAKQPYYFTRTDGQPMLFAGLYEHWRAPDAPDDAASLATCTIITTEPNGDIGEIHDRMPVILDARDVEGWLNVRDHGPDERVQLLHHAPEGTLAHHAVDASVGSIKNDGPELIAPINPQPLF